VPRGRCQYRPGSFLSALETGRRHVLSTAIEHKAVLEPLDRMRKLGFEVELAPVTPGGYVERETIRQRPRPDTLVLY
jgi:cysteine desulfurase